MKPGEELMLLLELNECDILKYKLKKQLEFEDSGNLELYKQKNFADLIVNHYSFDENEDFLHRNPLNYQSDWDRSVVSIDQFLFTHPEMDEEMCFKDLLALEDMNAINKDRILYDNLDNWEEEYREANVIKMENLREMMKLLPRRSSKYRKPGIAGLFINILLIFVGIMIYLNPEFIQSSSLVIVPELVVDLNQLLYDTQWFSFLGLASILLLVLYVILNNAFSRFSRDFRSEKNKYAERTFDKWEKEMKKSQLKQSRILNDYADLVIKEPSKSFLKLKTLIGPELLMNKFKAYVRRVESRHDWMTKHYSIVMFCFRTLFIASLFMFIIFMFAGFAFLRGWIGV